MESPAIDDPDPINPARVLLLARPAAGGMRTHLQTLLRGLARHGVEAWLAGPGDEPLAPARTVPLPVTDGVRPLDDARCVWLLASAVRRVAPAVVHAHGLKAALLAAAGRPAWPAAGLVVTVHGAATLGASPDGRPGRLARSVERWALASADRVIAVSTAVSEQLQDSFGVPPGRIAVIPNGIEPAPADSALASSWRSGARRELGLAPQTPLVGFVGRLAPHKGVPVFLEAASLVAMARPRTAFLVAGDGPLRPAVLEAAGRPELRGRLQWLGFRVDVPRLMAALDLVAVPSLQEGFSLVALEAMAAGRPVVASRVGGLTEVLGEDDAAGPAGLLVKPGDPVALADALVRLLQHPGLAAALGERGRERAPSFGAERMVRAILEAYRVAGRGSPRHGRG